MRILIYGLNYAPELTGTGKYTAEMAQALQQRGHEVLVVCAPPYYPDWKIAVGFSGWHGSREVRNQVRVWRAPIWVPKRPSGLKRLIHLVSFAAASLPALSASAFWRPDVVMTIAPSLLNAPAALAVARVTGAKSWLHIQDFEVDAAFDLGLLKSARAGRIALAVERAILRRFDVVSTISAKMLERVVVKGVASGNTFSLPNWVDTHAIYPLGTSSEFRNELDIPENATVVLYSGNMGAKQGIEVLADAAAALTDRRDIVFVFCGNGASKADLQKRCEGLSNCRFMPLQPVERLNALLGLADVHVLPQRADAADLVMPSKLTGMFASGRAVIAMARADTELYSVVAPRGLIVEPEDVVALTDAIVALAADPDRRAALGAKGRAFAELNLAPVSVLERLEARLRFLCRKPAEMISGQSVDRHAAAGLEVEPQVSQETVTKNTLSSPVASAKNEATGPTAMTI